MKHFVKFCFLFSLMCAGNVYSQQGDSTKVYIYEPFKSGQTIDQKKDIKLNQNCIKWDWSLLARGVFALNYERSLSSKFSLTLGAGLTYRDFFFEAIQDEDITSGDSYDRTVTPGIYIEGNLRFYPIEGDLEGFYMSPFIRYRNYNVESNLGTDNTKYSVGYKITDFGFTIGVQREVWYTGIMVDSYFGIGYRNRVVDGATSEDYSNPPKAVTTDTWVPAILLGFKIGIPF